MNSRNLGDLCWRCCAALYWIGAVLMMARGVNLVAWPWWWVLVPWFGIVAVFLLTLLFVLVMAAVDEVRAARERRRKWDHRLDR